MRIIIIGGGLAGSLTAIYLARRGHSVHVIEKRGDPLQASTQEHHPDSARALGVSMTLRGIKAVLGAGIPLHELEACGLPITGMAFSIGGRFRLRELPPQDAMRPLSLSRTAFQQLLHRHACAHHVHFHFHSKCVEVDLERSTVLFLDRQGLLQREQGDLLVGADGAHSALRQAMQTSLRRFEFSQRFFRHGYKNLVLPDAAELGFRNDLLYFFGMDSGGQFAGRAATLPGGSLTLAVCLPYAGDPGLESRDPVVLEAFFNRYFAMLPDTVRQTMVEQFLAKPANDLINVRSSTFHHQGNAVLLGDAAHATAPFLGQGMNMALEDAQVLCQLLGHFDSRQEAALSEFTRQRKVQADAMQDMALANYDVLSHASPLFFLRARYTRFMHELMPRLYPPDLARKLYFTSTPYDVLQGIQRRQNVWYKLGRVN